MVRYDGTTTTVFQYDPDNPFSYKGQGPNTIQEDKQGDIWIGSWTTNRLTRFERAIGRFIEYPQPGNPISKEDRINFIHIDKQGAVWTITSRHSLKSYVLDRLDPKTKRWTYFRHDPANPGHLATDNIYGMYDNEPINNAFTSFIEDSQGTIWIVVRGKTGNTLFRFDAGRDRFVRFRPKGKPHLLADFKQIGLIALDRQGQLYGSSYTGKGLFRVNLNSGQVEQFRHDPANANSLRCDSVFNVHVDGQGLVWVSTQQGLDQLNPKTGIFTHFGSKFSDPASPGSDQSKPGLLKFLAEVPNGNLWFLAGDNRSLIYCDRQQNNFG